MSEQTAAAIPINACYRWDFAVSASDARAGRSLHDMQGVSGSNPLGSIEKQFPPSYSGRWDFYMDPLAGMGAEMGKMVLGTEHRGHRQARASLPKTSEAVGADAHPTHL